MYIFPQGPGHKDQKTSHPPCRPDSPGTPSSCDCSSWSSQGGKKHPDPLPNQKLHATEARGHMWTRNHRVWYVWPLIPDVVDGLERVHTSIKLCWKVIFAIIAPYSNALSTQKQIDIL